MASFLLELVLMLIAFGLGAYFIHRGNLKPEGLPSFIVGVICLIVGLILLLSMAGVGIP